MYRDEEQDVLGEKSFSPNPSKFQLDTSVQDVGHEMLLLSQLENTLTPQADDIKNEDDQRDNDQALKVRCLRLFTL